MIIFNFHHIEPTPLSSDRKMITMSPSGFKRFIQMLRSLNFDIISIQEVLEAGGPQNISGNSVIITFDDGFENNFRYAAPILEEEKCPATFFILPGKLDGTNDWDHAHRSISERDKLMSLAQMKVLANSQYLTFGSHGMYHRHLPQLSEPELFREIRHSYTILSKELGKSFLPVFAYPWGEYSDKVVAMLERSPYQYAFTTDKQPWVSNENPYTIPRYSAYSRDGNPLILLGKLCRHQILFG